MLKAQITGGAWEGEWAAVGGGGIAFIYYRCQMSYLIQGELGGMICRETRPSAMD